MHPSTFIVIATSLLIYWVLPTQNYILESSQTASTVEMSCPHDIYEWYTVDTPSFKIRERVAFYNYTGIWIHEQFEEDHTVSPPDIVGIECGRGDIGIDYVYIDPNASYHCI
jgi:hypothetical protein